jgi:hypothetical protein
MIDEETRDSVGTEEGTRRDTWTVVCGGMVGWDCLSEIRTETGFGLAWVLGRAAVAPLAGHEPKLMVTS